MSKVEELQALIPELSEYAVAELLQRAQELRGEANGKPPFTPVRLRGIVSGLDLSLEELKELRREMWSGLGDLDNLDR